MSCSAEEDGRKYSFFVVEASLVHSQQGFIVDILYKNAYPIVNKTGSCIDHGLKNFGSLRLDFLTGKECIFIYCKQTSPGITQTPTYYFYNISSGFFIVKQAAAELSRCLINSVYISCLNNGFLSVINRQIYEY